MFIKRSLGPNDVWWVGYHFPLVSTDVRYVVSASMDGDELAYAAQLVARQDGEIIRGRHVVLEDSEAQRLVELIINDKDRLPQ